MGPPRSPLVCELDNEADVVDARWSRVVEMWLGDAAREAVTVSRVTRFEDARSFGADEAVPSVAITAKSLQVEAEGKGVATVDVTLVVDQAGNLIVAFTKPRDEWLGHVRK